MKILKYILLFIILPIILILSLDFFFGNIVAHNIFKNQDKYFRIRHATYHHDLKENISTITQWGGKEYRLCTDGSGFKSDCKNTFKINKKYDVAFIGDSFTEAIGIEYDKSFVGIISDKYNNLKIANLGVSSYSPSIYYSKLNYLLERGYSFGEVIVFIDISDIQDEATEYVIDFNNVKPINENIFSYKIKVTLNRLFPITYESLLNLNEIIKNKKNISKNNTIIDIYNKNYSRSGWTWGLTGGYEPFGVEGGIINSQISMNKLYLLLKKNNIKFSVAVYPWPGQLLHDKINSRHVEIWRNFCIDKCNNFYNFFPDFYNYSNNNGVYETINKFYIPNDVHFNELGNKIIADKIVF